MPINKLFQLLRPSRAGTPPSLSPEAQPPVAPAPGQPRPGSRLDRLDLQSAVIHHLEWCVQFNEHLSHINQADQPPVRHLPGADRSELGVWLLSAASRAPGEHPLFGELAQEHRRFHELAEEALKLAAEDRMDLASTLLNTDFERSRSRVLALLRDMQKG